MLSLLAFLVTTPLTFILLPLIIAWFLKNRTTKRILYGIAIVLTLVFTNTPLLKMAEEHWYKAYDRPLPEGKTYMYGIVLGGYSFWDWERNRPEFSGIADRLTEGIRLYKYGRIEKLVLASDGSIIQSKDGKGLQGNPQGMMKYLNELGIPKEDIIMETFANNTRENVTFTKELLGKEINTAPVLIITSAVHMKRSVSAFQAEGIYPDCYITDTWVNVKGQSVSFLPSVGTLLQWPELLHEWVGYVVYKFLYS
jgi:uncharacterized SAM-binding protein YcdF (DUF218 family)